MYVLIDLTLGHLRYHLTDVPPQPNSQPDSVFGLNYPKTAFSGHLEILNFKIFLQAQPWWALA